VRLLEIAAERGLQDLSPLILEAIARYLEQLRQDEERVDAAKAVLGSLSDEDADALEAEASQLRRSWR